MSRRIGLGIVTATLVMASTHDVRAYQDDDDDEPPPSRGLDRPSRPSPPRDPSLPYLFEIGARSAYATAPIRGGVNPFGLGVGGRLGFNLSGFYFGASAMDFMGGSDVGATDQAWLFGGELGYNVRLSPYVMLRPLLGAGDAVLSHTEPPPPRGSHVDVVTTASGSIVSGGGATTSVNNIYLQPGLTLLLASTNYFCGIGFSSLIVPGILYGPPPAQQTVWISYSGEGQAGFRF